MQTLCLLTRRDTDLKVNYLVKQQQSRHLEVEHKELKKISVNYYEKSDIWAKRDKDV